MKPKIFTFATTKNEVSRAILCGVDGLILEDAKISLVCRSDQDYLESNFNKLAELIDYALMLKKDIELKINCDLIFHSDHLKLILNLIELMRKKTLFSLRIQDPGLIELIKEKLPQAQLTYFNNSNNNLLGLKQLSKFVDYVQLNNESNLKDIKLAVNTIKNKFELQVHGQVLIQHSKRRYLQNLKLQKNKLSSVFKLIQDQDFLQFNLGLLDNPHGSFLFWHFEKCLIECIPILAKLKLANWIIDLRNFDPKYQEKVFKLYVNERNKYYANPVTWQKPTKAFAEFSGANNPDFLFEENFELPEHKICSFSNLSRKKVVGKIIDSVKDKYLIIELNSNLKLDQEVIFLTPENNKIKSKIKQIFDLTNQEILEGLENSLVKIPFKKGVISQSLILIN